MLLPIVLTLLGCEAECQSDSRMNGTYAVWQAATSPTEDIQGTGIEDYPWPAMFFNGYSEWTLEYVPAQGSVKIDINDQPFTSDSFYRAPEDCTNWTLGFSGTYVSEWGSLHSFSWTSALEYQGPNIVGTWTYQDEWTYEAQGTSGTISIPEGDVSFDPDVGEDTGG